MAKFPEVNEIGFANPIQVSIRWKTLVSRFDELGREQRRQKWLYPRRDIVVKYNYISKQQAETLWEFYLARKGTLEAFNFFMPEPNSTYPTYTGEYVATGDGSTTVFNLPCKNSLNRTLYIDGVAQTEGVNYNFTAGGGEDGADRIDFSDSGMTPPASGSRITLDFQGILKVRCRFAEDLFTFENFYDRLVTVGIELKGLLNDE